MQQDLLHRYIFEQLHVRGELVQLTDSYQQVLQGHDYPAAIQHLLGELLVATSLFTATLKFEGDISVQLQGDGALRYAVINGNHQQQLRGIARLQSAITDSSLRGLVGNGQLLITLTPTKGERYQGIVPLEADTLAECLELYFQQSEQLRTRLWIRTRIDQSGAKAAGMLLQVLPVNEQAQEDFDHLEVITNTVRDEELLDLPAEQLLMRLYHEDNPRLFPADAVEFKCGCSREKSAAALLGCNKQELLDALDAQGKLAVDCHFCNVSYSFTATDIEQLFEQQA